MEEIWKPIKGWEENYMVSNMGRVKSVTRKLSNNRRVYENLLTLQLHHTGTQRITLRGEGKKKTTALVPRLVAEHFIDNPEGLPNVRHKDGNKLNNVSTNLEWYKALNLLSKSDLDEYTQSKLEEERKQHKKELKEAIIDAYHHGIIRAAGQLRETHKDMDMLFVVDDEDLEKLFKQFNIAEDEKPKF